MKGRQRLRVPNRGRHCRKDYGIGAAKKLGMLWLRFFRTTRAASGCNAPGPQQIDLSLAFGDENLAIIANSLYQFGQAIRHHRNAIGVQYPFTWLVGIGPSLLENLMAFSARAQRNGDLEP
jgi:hypothetical protein